MANLVILESPYKVPTVKSYLGSGYKVMASVGHVRDLPKSTLGIDIDNNFAAHYINIRGKGDLIKEGFMAIYKEIVTKAVIAKGKKSFKDIYTITPEDEPSTVLGCWVINHNFKGYPSLGKIVIDGSFDVNIWYSYENDTKTNVISKTITYSDTTSVKSRENEITDNTEVIVRGLKQPTCSKVEIKNGNIEYTIDKELGIEIIGDTKAKVLVEEDEDPWEIIGEDANVDEQIDKEVNENYINDNN